MKKLTAAIAVCGMMAGGSALAATVPYTLTPKQFAPGAATIVDSFGIDDSFLVANSQINFANFDFFDITFAGLT